MINILAILIASTFTLTTIGCSHRQDSSAPELPKVLPEEEVIVDATGETAKEFYNHFLFHRVSHCPAPWYRYAGTNTFSMGQDGRGRIYEADLNLVIKSDGTYTAYYHEETIFLMADAPAEPPIKVELSRRWSLEGLEIIFEDLGRGTPVVINGRRKIKLFVEQDLIRLGLRGNKLQINAFTTDDRPIEELDDCGAYPKAVN